ncbi:MAG: HAMP domain-containing histidine kinase [Acidobacteria bacterium]|nr:HAMP domain-containing histidine kinase [Acidobacteriota bacterium]
MFSAILKRLTRSSLRARLTFWYLLTLGATLSVFAGGLLLLRARSAFETLDADLQVRAHRLSGDLRQDLFSLNVADALASDPRALAEPISVRASTGVTLYRSPVFPELTWSGEGDAIAAAREKSGERTIQDGQGRSFRMTTLDVPRVGADRLILQVAVAESVVTTPLGELALVLGVTIAFVLTVAGWGSRYTVGRALAPVDSIVARVRDIQAHRLGERLDVRADSDELDRLVATLNAMLDRLETSMSSARRFAADASHELQTPIAAIRGTLDMCLRSGASADEWRGTAVELLDDFDRLSELVRDLRLIALAEGGHLLDERERVPLAELVQDCCETAAAIADEQQVRVTAEALDPVIVSGSSRHLRRVLINLLQNAIRYSPSGASVLVSVGHADRMATLTVSDSGCGIDPADLPHIFEPFYRADPARARNTGGSGLGLAIADQIVRAHGGRIDVNSMPAHGSTFSVFLPLAGTMNGY